MSGMTSVTERLAALIPEETAKTIETVLATTIDGRRWLCATTGHVLAMVESDEPAREATIFDALIRQPREPVGIVSAIALTEWAGEAIGDVGEECDECDGSKVCRHCDDGRCPECEGSGMVKVSPPVRGGDVDDQYVNRELVARALAAVGSIAGDIAVLCGPDTKQRIGERGAPIWFQQKHWQIVVMPMVRGTLERGPQLLQRVETGA